MSRKVIKPSSFKKSLSTNKSQLKKQSRLPLIFLVVGLGLLLLSGLAYFHHQQTILAFDQVPQSTVVKQGNYPIRVNIPRQNINLPVSEAVISSGKWQIADVGVSHLSVSANPGQTGNIVIYGHNKSQTFGPLLKVKPEDQIVLTDKNGKQHYYVVFKTLTVSPYAVEVIQPTSSEILTLYTCTGFADSKRFVVQAKPKV